MDQALKDKAEQFFLALQQYAGHLSILTKCLESRCGQSVLIYCQEPLFHFWTGILSASGLTQTSILNFILRTGGKHLFYRQDVKRAVFRRGDIELTWDANPGGDFANPSSLLQALLRYDPRQLPILLSDASAALNSVPSPYPHLLIGNEAMVEFLERMNGRGTFLGADDFWERHRDYENMDVFVS